MKAYIKRSLEPVLEKAVSEFPAIILTGPRQSGKTTILKHLFGSRCGYVSLELPDIQSSASQDPRAFLEMHTPPVIFDGIQYAPNLLPYIKERIDAKRQETGQYILTGSLNILLMEKVTESLAGRAAIIRLLPFSKREIEMRPQALLPWEMSSIGSSVEGPVFQDLWEYLLRGSYPEIARSTDRDSTLWYASYVQTYLERDVRTLRQVSDLTQFRDFLRVIAARSAQLLNLTDVSRDLGVTVNTIKAWLSVLESTFQVIILRPYFANVGKRLVKTPKIYFTDVGTLCYLTGLKNPEHAASGPMAGAIMETAVVSEIVKTYLHRGLEPHIYFWRTSAGTEVDIIVEVNGRLVPIEVKASATPRPAMASAIKLFQSDLSDRSLPGYVVHPGDTILPLGSNVTAIPFASL